MKKILTLLMAFAAFSAHAQIYGEWNFDSDNEGWTSSGDGVFFDWTNEGPAPSASIWAVPDIITSTPEGWMMLDDDALGNGIATDSYMTSPTLDLSEAPSQLKLEFDQYFQEWETGLDTTQVQVSSNGGDTWHTVTINDGVGRSDRPNPEHIYINITPGIQDDPSNVIIRFRYRADWSYGWQIDNITITELPDYDLVAWNVFTDNVITEYEYRRVPTGQAQELEAGVVVRNLGALDLTGIVGTLDVVDPNSDSMVLTESVGMIDTVGTFDLDTIWLNTGVTPNMLGFYDFNFSLTANEPDDDIAVGNESLSEQYEITDEIYSHIFDEDINFASSGREQNGIWNEFMVGHLFECATTTDLLYVELKLDPETTPFQEIDVWVYESFGVDDAGAEIVEEITSYEYIYQIQEEDITGENYVTIPLGEQIELTAGSTYFIGVHALGGAEQLWVKGAFGDTDFSTVQWGDFNNGGADWWFGWPYSPSVRIGLGVWVPTVDEFETQAFSLGQNMPNPAKNITTIPVELKQAGKISLVVTDMMGRTVMSESYGSMPLGIQQLEIDVNQLEAGTYHYTVTVGEETLTRSMVVE